MKMLRGLTATTALQFPGNSIQVILCLAMLLTILLCPQFALSQDQVVLVGSGSSVPAPLYNRWVAEYNKRNPAIQLRYLPIGTSEGIKQIAKGSGDFGAGEVQLTVAERNEMNLVELPTVMIAIVPMYHIPGVHQELRFSGELLAEIFLGEIKNWNDPQIAKINPGVKLPDMPIKVFYRPAGKGTNYVFTEFLSKTSSKFRSRIGITPSPSWPVGAPAERSADMADKVKGEAGSIGYGELQYAVKSEVAYGKVLNAAGSYVKASQESIIAACRALEAPGWDKFAGSLTNPPGAQSFPITSFTWLYLRASGSDAKRAAALSDFLNWAYSDGELLARKEGYSELPQQLLAKVRAKAASLK
ncbi:MAG: phosphate ABC transporter substrate-binding protein PstS [Candidatus Acidiferrales bacterium]